MPKTIPLPRPARHGRSTANGCVRHTDANLMSGNVADLSNPILQDWVKPAMKKANDEVLAGGVAYRAHERCWPAGVPTFDTDVVGAPLFIYQRPNEITVIMEAGPEVRHIYLNVAHSKNPKP